MFRVAEKSEQKRRSNSWSTFWLKCSKKTDIIKVCKWQSMGNGWMEIGVMQSEGIRLSHQVAIMDSDVLKSKTGDWRKTCWNFN